VDARHVVAIGRGSPYSLLPLDLPPPFPSTRHHPLCRIRVYVAPQVQVCAGVRRGRWRGLYAGPAAGSDVLSRPEGPGTSVSFTESDRA
jgi:hypothetical protein